MLFAEKQSKVAVQPAAKKKRGAYGHYEASAMAAALNDMWTRPGSVLASVAKIRKVPRSSLQRLVAQQVGKGLPEIGQIVAAIRSRPNRKELLSAGDDSKLTQYFVDRAELSLPLNMSEARQKLSCILKLRKAARQRGGRWWWRRFFARHQQLSKKKPSALNRSRANACNSETLSQFYDLLDALFTTHAPVAAEQVWCADEKGVFGEATSRVAIGIRGQQLRQLHSGFSEHISVLAFGSAAGATIPPCMVFEGKRCVPCNMFVSDVCSCLLLRPKSAAYWCCCVLSLQLCASHSEGRNAGHDSCIQPQGVLQSGSMAQRRQPHATAPALDPADIPRAGRAASAYSFA